MLTHRIHASVSYQRHQIICLCPRSLALEYWLIYLERFEMTPVLRRIYTDTKLINCSRLQKAASPHG